MSPSPSVRAQAVLLLAVLAAARLPVLQPGSQDEYFTGLWSADFALVGYHDSRSSPSDGGPMEKLLGRLSADPLLAEWGFALLLADTAAVPMLPGHYGMTESPCLYLFVRKQLVKCPNFPSVFADIGGDPEALANYGAHWVHRQLGALAVEVASLADFEARLAASRILALYYAAPGSDLRLFRRWAARYLHFAFVYTASPDLVAAVFASRHLAPPPAAPLLAVVRDASLVTEFDPHPIVATAAVASEDELTRFFGFERLPKLMDASLGANITQMLFHHNEKLVLLVTSAATPPADVAAFHRALADLPKRMVYSQVDVASPHVAAFLQLFMLAGLAMTPGRLYAVHVLPTRQVDVQPMHEPLSPPAVLRFVSGLVERHAEFFGVARPAPPDPAVPDPHPDSDL